MSEPENFIARWSRRKRETAHDAEAPNAAAVPEATADAARADGGGTGEELAARVPDHAGERPQPAALDPAKLPPIESITAETDIRDFLAPGVPPDLARAALRRAWSADPNIREFIGLSENSWDFNSPGSMAGFGPLEMTDELRRQIARIVAPGPPEPEESGPPFSTAVEREPEIGRVEAADTSTSAADATPTAKGAGDRATLERELGETGDALARAPIPQRDMEHAAAKTAIPDPVEPGAAAKRRHGSALPK